LSPPQFKFHVRYLLIKKKQLAVLCSRKPFLVDQVDLCLPELLACQKPALTQLVKNRLAYFSADSSVKVVHHILHRVRSVLLEHVIFDSLGCFTTVHHHLFVPLDS
jgi:hypothetical protein